MCIRDSAGGVSGGIFVNENIEDAESEWEMIKGVPRNLPISVLTYDPNNLNIFYAGTGEIFTGWDPIGNGLWKSTDSGLTWENIFGGKSDSEQVFTSQSNKINIINKNDENPMNFGIINKNGTVIGTYLHGFFNNNSLRQELLSYIRLGRNINNPTKLFNFDQFKQNELDRLCNLLTKSIKMNEVSALIGI